jgi:hypothetical protein
VRAMDVQTEPEPGPPADLSPTYDYHGHPARNHPGPGGALTRPSSVSAARCSAGSSPHPPSTSRPPPRWRRRWRDRLQPRPPSSHAGFGERTPLQRREYCSDTDGTAVWRHANCKAGRRASGQPWAVAPLIFTCPHEHVLSYLNRDSV